MFRCKAAADLATSAFGLSAFIAAMLDNLSNFVQFATVRTVQAPTLCKPARNVSTRTPCLRGQKTRAKATLRIALFTVTFSHLHYNVFEPGCETISGNFVVSARNCLTSTFKNILMQMRKGNCEKGYFFYTV